MTEADALAEMTGARIKVEVRWVDKAMALRPGELDPVTGLVYTESERKPVIISIHSGLVKVFPV